MRNSKTKRSFPRHSRQIYKLWKRMAPRMTNKLSIKPCQLSPGSRDLDRRFKKYNVGEYLQLMPACKNKATVQNTDLNCRVFSVSMMDCPTWTTVSRRLRHPSGTRAEWNHLIHDTETSPEEDTVTSCCLMCVVIRFTKWLKIEMSQGW